MIQWLNVRAVGAIKASTFEGKRPSPPSSSVSSYSSSPHAPLPHLSPGWFEGWCADLVIQIKATLSAQGSSLFSLRVPDLSSHCQPPPRPAAREDLIKLHSFSSTSVNSSTVTQIGEDTKLLAARFMLFLIQAWVTWSSKNWFHLEY